MGYWENRAKFYFFLPLPKKKLWLFPHHNSSRKSTVSANAMPIRTVLFFSATSQVGEPKILYNPQPSSLNSKLLHFSQRTNPSKKKFYSLHILYQEVAYIHRLYLYILCLEVEYFLRLYLHILGLEVEYFRLYLHILCLYVEYIVRLHLHILCLEVAYILRLYLHILCLEVAYILRLYLHILSQEVAYILRLYLHILSEEVAYILRLYLQCNPYIRELSELEKRSLISGFGLFGLGNTGSNLRPDKFSLIPGFLLYTGLLYQGYIFLVWRLNTFFVYICIFCIHRSFIFTYFCS